MLSRRACCALFGFALCTGCRGPLDTPLDAFHEGRLPLAAAELRRLEPASQRFGPRERARYALYRGLTHLGLGDARAAGRWLSLAKRWDTAAPDSYDASERGELHSAWRSMGKLAGEER